MSYYSTHFGVKHSAFVGAGVFDGQIGEDASMHINPLMLRNCKEAEFDGAYEEFLAYFKPIMDLAKHVQNVTRNDRCFRQICVRFQFKELPNTGLGYATNGSHGNGISGKLAQQLAINAIEIVRLGIEDPTIFALLPLFEEGIGADRISDMTISILYKRFLAYTARKAKELSLPTILFVNKTQQERYLLPHYKRKCMVLIPASILSDLPMASDPADIDHVSGYNSSLRKIICEAIGLTWKDYEDMHKSDLKRELLADAERLEGILSKVSVATFQPYDFTRDGKLKYLYPFIKENIIEPNPLKLPEVTERNVMDVVMQICTQFKDLIEVHHMSVLLYKDGKPQKEDVVQRLFYCIAISYCEANDIDINRESDSGCGELDFKFSVGAHKKVIIEVKLSGNNQLVHGLTTQLPIYMEAENTQEGIYMVMRMSPKDDNEIEKVIEAHDGMPERALKPRLLIIDAVPRPSASKA